MCRITIVLEYEGERDCPPFGANMEAFGGKVVAVQFNDALSEASCDYYEIKNTKHPMCTCPDDRAVCTVHPVT